MTSAPIQGGKRENSRTISLQEMAPGAFCNIRSSRPSRPVKRLRSVEQAVVYSTLPQEYSTLTFMGEVVVGGGGVEERS